MRGNYLGHGVLFDTVRYEWVDPDNHDLGAMNVSVDVYQAGPGDCWNATTGDPGPDLVVDVPDIQQILREAKFNSGKPAVWVEGDFNDDGLVTAADIQLVLSANLFKKGRYDLLAASLEGDLPNVLLRLTPDGLLIDTQGAVISGYVLGSETGLLTGELANNVGLFQTDSDKEISGQMFAAICGDYLLGKVTAADVSLEALAGDLHLSYTVAGQSGIYEAMLAVPEPAALGLLSSGLLALAAFCLRRRSP